MPAPTYPFWVYFWRVQNPRTKRWFTTRHRCTEEQIRKEHPEAIQCVFGAMEIDGPAETYPASGWGGKLPPKAY